MRILYTFLLRCYITGIRIAAFWNSKAREWVEGRRDVWGSVSKFQRRNVPCYWFHCASLGEFEQGRPLMEALKQREDCQLVITFFSPSGYRIRKNYDLADAVFYLPADTRKNARKFLERICPTSVLFIKYEFWPNYILSCAEQKIPIWSVSALFRSNQIFFRWYGGFMRKVLRSFTGIFVQNEASAELLKGIGLKSTVAGDTRYDRVMSNASSAKHFPEIEKFGDGKKVLVCGSVWNEDILVLAPLINGLGADWKVIIAPHEIDEANIRSLEEHLKISSIRYSSLTVGSSPLTVDFSVLIIDNIGMLMHLYQYGQVAYIGGAFRTGLHNILEPAAFGLPVILGPKHEKFPEAKEFISAGIGFSVASADELRPRFDQLKASPKLRTKVLEFMESRKGATEVILGIVTPKVD